MRDNYRCVVSGIVDEPSYSRGLAVCGGERIRLAATDCCPILPEILTYEDDDGLDVSKLQYR